MPKEVELTAEAAWRCPPTPQQAEHCPEARTAALRRRSEPVLGRLLATAAVPPAGPRGLVSEASRTVGGPARLLDSRQMPPAGPLAGSCLLAVRDLLADQVARRQSGATPRVVVCGAVPAEPRPATLCRALCLVCPSLPEAACLAPRPEHVKS